MHECVQHEERFVSFLDVLDVSHLRRWCSAQPVSGDNSMHSDLHSVACCP